MIRDKGFWDGRALGEEVNDILGFMDPCWLMGVELELLGGSDCPAKNINSKLLMSQQYKEQH